MPSSLSWLAAPQLHLQLHQQQRQSPSLTLLQRQLHLQVRHLDKCDLAMI